MLASALLAIVLTFANVALWALALNFAAPMDQGFEQAGGGAGLNRRRAFADQANGSREPRPIAQGGENG